MAFSQIFQGSSGKTSIVYLMQVMLIVAEKDVKKTRKKRSPKATFDLSFTGRPLRKRMSLETVFNVNFITKVNAHLNFHILFLYVFIN